jgi:transcriptional regulator with XRE-family HTH domain
MGTSVKRIDSGYENKNMPSSEELSMMTLGQRIRFFRNLLKKTQDDIKDETGIPQTTLSNWERDLTEPVVSDAKKLANVLKVSLMELIEGQDQQAACLPKTG